MVLAERARRGPAAPSLAETMDDPMAYNAHIQDMRAIQYPMLKDATYLDHAGTTLYSKALMDRFHTDMMGNLFGNPHSASPSSQQSTQLVEDVRLELLRFFKADPEEYDLVFTANATAAIKLVMEAFREQEAGFWYGYHVDSHTSLVGVRESAREHRCFGSDEEVHEWIEVSKEDTAAGAKLFAYPAQSNMNGRRLPLEWTVRLSGTTESPVHTLLDAAAFTSTSQLDLSNAGLAPDFVTLSLYKIFGFPDLGALIVRKTAAPVFAKRRYFGGGTVDMVLSVKEQWHATKTSTIHEQLEDGTLPIHSIIALKAAMETHAELYETMDRVARHTAMMAQRLYDELAAMKHNNGLPVATIYRMREASHGPVVAFNLRNAQGEWISNTEIEKVATVKNIHLRTGGLCNPGGIASSLGLEPWEMRDNFSAGHRCGSDNDVLNGKPTGMIRISLGAMSTLQDVERFLSFIDEFFVDHMVVPLRVDSPMFDAESNGFSRMRVESLTVYPIKSCAGWRIPHNTPWEVRQEGLAWDREWCIVHQGTGAALSQKRYPRMALIRPELDFESGMLVIRQAGNSTEASVPLSLDPSYFSNDSLWHSNANVCGEVVRARLYTSAAIAAFLTATVGVPCTLARFPNASIAGSSTRHSKSHLTPLKQQIGVPRPILLSNESPILTINRSSLNRLNEEIKLKGGKAAHPAVFRANIVLAEDSHLPPGREQPWAEDEWDSMQIGGPSGPKLEFLGGCRRCQMVCVDQQSAEKNEEPFVSLAKTRRFGGRVLFGVHTALMDQHSAARTICVGDEVQTVKKL
jgi:molybdenum cofactor sulfurtransferase